MTPTPQAADVFWDEDPAPVPQPPRPLFGSDCDWWRAASRARLEDEDAVERSRRLGRPALDVRREE